MAKHSFAATNSRATNVVAVCALAMCMQACGRREEAPSPVRAAAVAPVSPLSGVPFASSNTGAVSGSGYRIVQSKPDLVGDEVD